MHKQAAPATRSYFRLLSLRAKFKLFAAVFCIFAPLSILVVSPFHPARSITFFVVWSALGGLTAAGWAYVGTLGRRVLWLLIPSQTLWVVLPATILRGDFPTGFTFSLAGTYCIVLIVVGYILFVKFIGSEGARSVRMQAELTLAQQIHANLISPINTKSGRLELFGRSLAGAEMGGDLIDVVGQGDRTDVIIADVSGHGVRAGVVMGMVKSAIHTRLRDGAELGALLTDVNQVIEELTSPEMFVTAACLRFDTSPIVKFVGAGHGAVLHYQAKTNSLGYLESAHLPLGVAPSERYVATEHAVAPGDVLLLMTDGLVETFDDADQALGQQPIEALLLARHDEPLPRLYEALMAAVSAHGPQTDDQSVLLVRVLG